MGRMVACAALLTRNPAIRGSDIGATADRSRSHGRGHGVPDRPRESRDDPGIPTRG